MYLVSAIVFVIWIIPLLVLVFMGSMGAADTTVGNFSNIIQTIAPMVTALFCFWTMGVFDNEDPSRKGWMFIGLGAISWFLGQVIYSLYELIVKQTVPFPYYSDVAYFMTAVFMIIGIYFLWTSLKSSIPMWGWILATILLAGALYWTLSLVGAGWSLEYIVSYLYAITDSLLIFFSVLLASSLLGGMIGNQLWIMIVGFIIYFLGDQLYNITQIAGTYKTGGYIDISWALAFGLIAVTAISTRSALTHKY